MECPYCRGELEPGKLYASYGGATSVGYWYPAGTKPLQLPTVNRLKKIGGFRLSGHDPIGPRNAEAWYCRTCNRLTVFNANAKR